MKKILAVVIALMLLSACVVNAFAASGITADEQKIVTALSQTVVLNDGSTFKLPAKYINQAEDYLTKFDLSSDKVDTILGCISDSVVLFGGVTKDNIDTVADGVIDNAKKAAQVLGATLYVTRKTNPGASTNYTAKLVFPKTGVEGYDGTTYTLMDGVIKQTGAQGNMLAVAAGSVLAIAAVAYVVVSSKKALSK